MTAIVKPPEASPSLAGAPESGAERRRTARIAILSQGTSEFDSRAQRIARSLAARGDTVTIYSRYLPELPAEELLDGYRIVRLPLSASNARQAAASRRAHESHADPGRSGPGARSAPPGSAAPQATEPDDGPSESSGRPVGRAASGTVARIDRLARAALRRVRHVVRRTRRRLGERFDRLLDAIPVSHRFRQFPIRPRDRARWYARQVEPHDIWHGMWAGSLPALEQVRARHGGRTVYDARDVYLRSRAFDSMPRWQRWIMTRFERRWAHAADAVIQVSEPYAEMMRRDLGLTDVPVVRNCPDRWDPPDPRPDRIRRLLDIPSDTAVVLYQGLVMSDRGIEQTMDAILEVPNAVLVIMGPGNQVGRQSSRDPYIARSLREPYAGKVHVIDAVPPAELLFWSASSDVMVMPFQPNTENHRFVTPQKMWEAMAAGVPVVASDLPGMAPVVTAAGCGLVCDPTSPAAIAGAIRQLLDEGPAGLRARGDRGLAAAHATYNWEAQFEVLVSVYARLLRSP